MYEQVVNLLKALGYEVVPENDDWMIEFLITKNTNYILCSCHLNEVPETIIPKLTEKIVGEFLLYMKNSGQLLDIYDLQPTVKTIKEGDTQVNYAIGEGNMTPEKRLDTLITSLTNNFERFVSQYRSVPW